MLVTLELSKVLLRNFARDLRLQILLFLFAFRTVQNLNSMASKQKFLGCKIVIIREKLMLKQTDETTPFLKKTCTTATTNDYEGRDTGLLCSQHFNFGSITGVPAGFQKSSWFWLRTFSSQPSQYPLQINLLRKWRWDKAEADSASTIVDQLGGKTVRF